MTDSTVHDPGPPAPPAPRGEIPGADWRLGLLVASTVALGALAGMGWLIIIGALVLMIFLHELGHFLTAKWSGMKVTEFFLFFGPKIWSFRRGETEYGIKLIPLGAYVRIIGMSNLDADVLPEDEHRTFRQQSYPKRLLVVSAGSLMHMLQAFVLLVIVFSGLGVPGNTLLAERLGGPPLRAADWTIGDVSAGSAAAVAGIRAGDDLLSIEGRPIRTFDDVGAIVGPRAGDAVDLVVQRGTARLDLHATLGRNPNDPARGFLGIGAAFPDMPPVRVNPARGALESGRLTGELMSETVKGLGAFFSGGLGSFASDVVHGGATVSSTTAGTGTSSSRASGESRLVSIYGVARIGNEATKEGMVSLLLLMANVNISIGLLNMIPLLPLDGGHVAIATYERLRSTRRRRYMADVSRLLPITYAVVIFMLMLGVSSIYLDIVAPVG